ncbi:MAG TPA: fumarylacetoacetase [Terriglobales bacterium]|nr:fumarylacetoacetase [Terriglobales bacterium]
MTYSLNETHDPAARSWVKSANTPGTDFPIQNLPLGVFDRGKALTCIGVAIGDQILNLTTAAEENCIPGIDEITNEALMDEPLNLLMALGRQRWSALRRSVFNLLKEGAEDREKTEQHLVAQSEVQMLVPAVVGDYTDFYASIFHATNVGSMFRPDNPLLPNYKWVPIGYHGRASSIVPSGTHVKRPTGQLKPPDADKPIFGPSKRLDYELEVGVFIGGGNELGSSVSINEAEDHAFGLCLVNDWSARDVQAWEYQPLGPFLAKNFATTISPWVVTMEALAPYRIPAFKRADDDPAPLPYLTSEADQRYGGIDLNLEVLITSKQMRDRNIAAHSISRGNFRHMYWTVAQLITHHASNGCNLQPGDLLASGTVSGPEKQSRGCLLEMTWGGKEPIQLPSGEKRSFLEDGDEVILRGYCERNGAAHIGFGECRGRIVG